MEVKPAAPAAPHLLSLADVEGISILRKLFDTANYSVEGLRGLLGTDFSQGMPLLETPMILRSIPGTGLLSTLIKLFALGIPVDADAVADDLKPLTPERLEAMGLIRLGPAGAEPLARFSPFGSLIVGSDPQHVDYTATPADYVLEINPTSVSLDTVVIRQPVKTTLDLGTGCGILSLLAAAHSGHVVATDINPRALRYTAFNALLNGLTNIECREGSLLEPVAGETFDLIMCNPPYVVSPDTGLQFRDGGRPLDSLCSELVRDIPRHMNEGGFAAVLAHWVLRKGEDWATPPARWLEGSGCDQVIFHTTTETPLSYSWMWNRSLARFKPEAFEVALDRWTDYFNQAGVLGIAAGGVVLRKRPGHANWVVRADVSPGRVTPCGDHLLRIIAAQDWLNSGVGDSDLLQSAFRPAEDLRLEQSLGVRDGRIAQAEYWACLSGGFRFRVEINEPASRIVTLGDGHRKLSEIVEILAPDFSVGIDEVRKMVVAATQHLFAMGFLVRAPRI